MLHKLLGLVVSVAALMVVAVVAISAIIIENDMASCGDVNSGGSNLCGPADAIVAVSGGDTTARTKKAVQLYQAGYANKIIFSGAAADATSISNAEAMRRIAEADGVPASAIYLDESSEDTKQNAANVVDILHNIGAKNVILVSSPYHLKRVKMNFQTIDNTISYRTIASEDQHWDWWFLKPNGWVIASTEVIGIAELSAEVK